MRRLILILLIPVACFGWQPPEADYSVVYKITTEAELSLHVYGRWDVKPGDYRIGIVFFNGGGWRKGNWQQFACQSNYLSRLGYVCICVEYRVIWTHGTTVYDCVDDAVDAMRFVRSHAHFFGIDPNRIIAGGGSAGGHLAIMTALNQEFNITSSRPNGLIIFNGVLDTSPEGFGSNIIGSTWINLSPFHHLRAGMPDTIIFHGVEDRTVPVRNAINYAERARDLGDFCRLYVYGGQPHGFFNYSFAEFPIGFNPYYYKIMQEVIVFLRRFENE